MQVKQELESTLAEKTKVPTEKYTQPVTTAQEIGWMHLEYGNVSNKPVQSPKLQTLNPKH